MNVDENQVEDKRDEKWMEEVRNRKEEALLSLIHHNLQVRWTVDHLTNQRNATA